MHPLVPHVPGSPAKQPAKPAWENKPGQKIAPNVIQAPNGNLLHLQKTLGEGKGGSVHLATNLATQEKVAVKQVNPEPLGKRMTMGGITTKPHEEAAITGKAGLLSGPGFPLKGSGKSVIPMKVVPGRPISPPRDAADFVKKEGQMESVMKDLHSKGVIHNDLKFDNVMKDGKGNLRPIDYGWSKQVKGDAHPSGFTKAFDAHTLKTRLRNTAEAQFGTQHPITTRLNGEVSNLWQKHLDSAKSAGVQPVVSSGALAKKRPGQALMQAVGSLMGKTVH
jgi:serine/threonine protein kinase